MSSHAKLPSRALTRLHSSFTTITSTRRSSYNTHPTSLNMADGLTNGTPANVDVEMKEEEAAAETSLSSIQQAQDSIAPTSIDPAMLEHQSTIQPPVPAIATPPAASSANAPARPGSMPPQPSARPSQPVAHGGPTRQYLNSNITPHLLEGMKRLAVDEPEKPLLWLSNFLREKSKEVEGA